MAPAPGVEDLLRAFAPQVLGVVARRYGDFDEAEDAVQEALLAAATQWPVEGTPDNPRGWLIQVAARRMVDQIRSDDARRRREDVAARQATGPVDVPATDDTLQLLFLCCHPALTPGSAIALTLRAVGGLTTAEIARAFLVPEATMAQRISRAKARIRDAGGTFPAPASADSPARLAAVLHTLYLVFNEGYVSSGGEEGQRVELAAEAIRLTRRVREIVPDDPETAGLLALMVLTHARRHARTGPHGELVPLGEQDRGRWDRAAIDEGAALLAETLPRGVIGPYQVQAAIAAVHDEAPTATDTDWPQILALYGVLSQLQDSPMVRLNEAIAAAMVHGPRFGLDLLDALARDDRLAGGHRLEATRAHLLELDGDPAAAITAYRAAAARTASRQEQQYLTLRAARLADQSDRP